MPTIAVEKLDFLGRCKMSPDTTRDTLDHLFFDLGLELDDVEEEEGKDAVEYIFLAFVFRTRKNEKIEMTAVFLSIKIFNINSSKRNKLK